MLLVLPFLYLWKWTRSKLNCSSSHRAGIRTQVLRLHRQGSQHDTVAGAAK